MSTKQRLSASVDSGLLASAHAAVAAGRADSVSAWVNDALRRQLEHERRLAALAGYLTAYEAERGEIGEEEMLTAVRQAESRSVAVRPRTAAPRPADMTIVFDAGGLVALERGDRARFGGGGSGRQAAVAALAGVETVPLDDALGRRVGVPLGRSGHDDVIDAAVVLLARDGD